LIFGGCRHTTRALMAMTAVAQRGRLRLLLLRALKLSPLLCLIARYILQRLAARKRTAIHHCTQDGRMADILRRLSQTMDVKYIPPWWATNGWVNLVAFVIKTRVYLGLGSAKLQRQTLHVEDGGEISIDWMDDEATRALPETAPILVVLHTITGCGAESWHFLREVPAYGWRACVLNRRGCSMPLRTPKFSIMGCAVDTRKQMDAVLQRYPRASFIGMIGLSAGSGLLISYLGKQGANSSVNAAVSLCPGYDIGNAFKELQQRYPLVDKSVTQEMKKCWINGPNADLLKSAHPEAFRACENAGSVDEFLTNAPKFAGCETLDAYLEEHNPMNFVEGIVCPTLILNAEDDPVCMKDNVRVDLVENTPNFALVFTETGSHIAYCTGWAGQRTWMVQLAMRFMEAARAHQAQREAEGKA